MRRLIPPLALLFACCALSASPWPAHALPPGYTLQLVQTFRDMPTTLRFAPDGRLFYTEMFTGRIMVYPTGTSPTPSVWATVPIAIGGERGMQGLAFHPDWPDSPFVYVFHTRPSPIYNRVARLRDQNGVGVNYTVLLDSLFASSVGRFGGRLAFGPDRNLYVTIGDCTFTGAPQDPSNTIGKILRLGFTGKAAPGNPWGANNPVCAMGVRNPYGLCFDPVTGYGYFSDNGPLCDDEMNRLIIGANYGWGPDDVCGSQPPGTYAAMLNLTPTIGVTGCTMYRSTTYAGYNGNIFLGSYADGSVRRIVFHSTPSSSIVDSVEVWATVTTPETHILDVTQGTDGRIWFSTFDQIWRVLEPSTAVGVSGTSGPEGLTVAPNPSAGTVAMTLANGAEFDLLEIVDVAGRQVRRWPGPIPERVVWDGRDETGHIASTGVYWVRATGRGHSVLRRMARIGR